MAYLRPVTKLWLLERKEVAEGNCWLWTMMRDSDGYGRVAQNQTGERAAHRVAWVLFRGPIPDDLTIDHICFTRACVNPDHLQLLTRVENSLRRRDREPGAGGHQEAANPNQRPCRNGHRAGFYILPSGGKECLECRREARIRYRKRKRQEKASA